MLYKSDTCTCFFSSKVSSYNRQKPISCGQTTKYPRLRLGQFVVRTKAASNGCKRTIQKKNSYGIYYIKNKYSAMYGTPACTRMCLLCVLRVFFYKKNQIVNQTKPTKNTGNSYLFTIQTTLLTKVALILTDYTIILNRVPSQIEEGNSDIVSQLK